VLENDIHSVAKKESSDNRRNRKGCERCSEKDIESKPSELKRLGIDEIAVIKAKRELLCSINRLEKSKLIGCCQEKTRRN
jgi:hypothetical protein